MACAPIAVFAFNRPGRLRNCLASLKKNSLASESEVVIFIDGPRNLSDVMDVRACKREARLATGFLTVRIIERPENYGLVKSIRSGVSQVLAQRSTIIVVEDDLEVSEYFLEFMNEGLATYASVERVASIHGYVYPSESPFDAPFFLRGADCWGWATWRSRWDQVNFDAKRLYQQLKAIGGLDKFDFQCGAGFSTLLQKTIENPSTSWAICWHASMFLQNRLTLYPNKSLVKNVGLDGFGTNCAQSENFDVEISDRRVCGFGIELQESEQAYLQFQKFFLKLNRRRWNRIFKRFWTTHYYRSRLRSLKEFLKIKLNIMFPQLHGPISNVDLASRSVGMGYADPLISKKVKQATLALISTLKGCERDSVVFDKIQYSYPMLLGLSLAAQNCPGLKVIDFGGSLGSSYFQTRHLHERFNLESWSVIEQPEFVMESAEIKADKLSFYKTAGEALEQVGHPSILILSSVLQYLDNPYKTFAELVAKLRPSYILVDRTPFTDGSLDRAYLQRVPRWIYSARYVLTALSEKKFMKSVPNNYDYIEIFPAFDGSMFSSKGDEVPFKAVLLELNAVTAK